jgi:hypothetical protein
MNSGTSFTSVSTLGEVLDAMFTRSSPELDAASATFQAIDPVVLMVGWPGYNDAIRIRFDARPLEPNTIVPSY